MREEKRGKNAKFTFCKVVFMLEKKGMLLGRSSQNRGEVEITLMEI